MITKPIFEFLMWNNCNNNCKFCFQKQFHDDLTIDQRTDSISKILDFYKSSTFIKGSHVLLMGGEIFDTPSIFDKLKHLFDVTINMMVNKEIDILYINTNLIYKKLDTLVYLFDLISTNDLFERFKFTTSYDVDGRFCTKTESLMLSNLQQIKTLYPKCHIVVNSMLSNKLCDDIISGVFDVDQFVKKYNLDLVNLIPYIVLIKDISAPRSKIFKTLRTVENNIPGYITQYIHNFDLNQPKLLYKYNRHNGQYEFCSCDYLECGHAENFKKYSDHGTCFVCDLKTVFSDYV